MKTRFQDYKHDYFRFFLNQHAPWNFISRKKSCLEFSSFCTLLISLERVFWIEKHKQFCKKYSGRFTLLDIF